jgi:hypothetical protein
MEKAGGVSLADYPSGVFEISSGVPFATSYFFSSFFLNLWDTSGLGLFALLLTVCMHAIRGTTS